MDKKYWVPALERAHAVLQAIAEEPSRLKLMELSKKLSINKSTMFSLLHTLEALHWVVRDKADTYSLGPVFARFGSSYFQQYSLVDHFHKEAIESMRGIGETIQMGKLDGRDVFYLAKMDAPSPVRIASDPGMRFPAHATGLGKALLACLSDAEVDALYGRDEPLPQITPFSLTDKRSLLAELERVRQDGYACDLQESVIGFCCVAAPILDSDGQARAAVSFSMPQHLWEQKKDAAREEICGLAARLSLSNMRSNA
ncbi:IclR family transcriptional regulator [Paenibacillus sp. MBLB4367]|uniref:IclR family transcriptional regulator n=1 Tax=Paenibacillus sp. MBLB4367 TaxID=3384767 RepID=UPI003907FA86